MRNRYCSVCCLVCCLAVATVVRVSPSAENSECVWSFFLETSQPCSGSGGEGTQSCDLPCNQTACSGSRIEYSGNIRSGAETGGSVAVKQISVNCHRTILCEVQLESYVKCTITVPLLPSCSQPSILHNCAYCSDGTPLAWVQTTTMTSDPSVNCSSSGG